MAFGTSSGELLVFDFIKKEEYLTQQFPSTPDRIMAGDKKDIGEKVLQICNLPEEFQDARKAVFYVVTQNNVYCISKRKNLFNSGGSFGATAELAKITSHDKYSAEKFSRSSVGFGKTSYELEDPIRHTDQSSNPSNSMKDL